MRGVAKKTAVSLALTVSVVIAHSVPSDALQGALNPIAKNAALLQPTMCLNGGGSSGGGSTGAVLNVATDWFGYGSAVASSFSRANVPANTKIYARGTGNGISGHNFGTDAVNLIAGAGPTAPPPGNPGGQGLAQTNGGPGGAMASNGDIFIGQNSTGAAQDWIFWGGGSGNNGGQVFGNVEFWGVNATTGQPISSSCPGPLLKAIKNGLGRTSLAVSVDDPVNSSTGNLTHSILDLPSPSGVFGLTFERTYNSMDWPVMAPISVIGQGSVVGRKWTTSMDIALTPLDDYAQAVPGSSKGMELRFADGRRVEITGYSSGSSSWTVPDELKKDVASVTWDAASTRFVVTLQSGEIWRFDNTGRLDMRTAPDGQFAKMCYQASGGANIKMRHGKGTPNGSLCSLADTDPAVDWQLVVTDSNTDARADQVRLQYQGTNGDDPIVDFTYYYGYLSSATSPHKAADTAQPTVITTSVGVGSAGYSGDGGPAWQGQIRGAIGLAVDPWGALHIADSTNNRLRRVAGGQIITYGGTGTASSTGDGGQAKDATFNQPKGLAMDASGNLYVAEGSRIRMITPNGETSTVPGTDTLSSPRKVAVNGANVYVTENDVVKKITGGTVTVFAGNGTPGSGGDGGAATSAQLNGPRGIAFDAANNALYIADVGNNKIRRVDSAGVITTVAGTGVAGFSGDGGAATSAQLNAPASLALDTGGNLVIADQLNHRVRKVAGGTITTIMGGGGPAGFAGDFGPPTAARLNAPSEVVVDHTGAVHVADRDNNRIRSLTTYPGESYLTDGTNGALNVIFRGQSANAAPIATVYNHYDAYGRVDWQNLTGGDHVHFEYANPTGTPPKMVTTVRYCTVVNADGTCTTVREQFSYRADDRGRTDQETDSASTPAQTNRSWNNSDRVEQITDRLNVKTGTAFDGAGRSTQQGASDATGTGFLPPLAADAGAEPCKRQSDGTFPTPNSGACAGKNFAVAQTSYCPSGTMADRARPMTQTDVLGVATKFFYGTNPGNANDQCYQSGLLIPTKTVSAAGTPVEATRLAQVTDNLPTQTTDPDGYTSSTTWDTTKRVPIAATVSGRTTYYGYDRFLRPVVTRDPAGNEVWNTYDAAGRLLSQIGPLPGPARTCAPASGCNFPADGHPDVTGPTTTSVYRLDGTVMAVSDAEGLVSTNAVSYRTPTAACIGAQPTCTRRETEQSAVFSGIDARKLTTLRVYNSAGQLLTERRGDPNVPAEQATTTYTYGPMGTIDTVTSPTGLVTTFRYDSVGRMTKSLVGSDTATDSHATSTEYDTRGRVTRQLGPSGDVDYNATNNSARACVAYQYDQADRVVLTTTGAVPSSGPGCAATTATKLSNTWVHYDAAGRKDFAVRDHDGTGAAPAWNSSGALTSADSNDLVLQSTYSAGGRQATLVTPPADLTCYNFVVGQNCSGGAVAKRTMTYTYYSNSQTGAGQLPGYLASVADPENGSSYQTSYEYSDDGRLSKTTSPGGNYTRYTYGYDVGTLGRTTSTFTPSPTGSGEARSDETYMKNGWLKTSTGFYGTGLSPATVSYSYYGNGLVSAVANPLNGSNDVATYSYDSRGNRLGRTIYTKDGVSGSTHTVTDSWTWDLDDRVLTAKDPGNNQTAFTYYANNEVGSGQAPGLLKVATSPSGRTDTRQYWNSGNLKTQTYALTGQTSITVGLWWDAHGNRLRTAAPTTGAGQVNTDYSYDASGRLVTAVNPDASGTTTTSWTWDLNGNQREIVYPLLGAKARYSHDKINRLTSVESWNGTAYVPLASETWNRNSQPTSESVAGYGTRTWTYPANNAVKASNYAESFAAQLVNTSTDLTWRHDGRIGQEAPHSGFSGNTRAYTYDAAGQLTCRASGTTCPGSVQTNCSNGGSGLYIYSYDPRGQRMCQSADGVVTAYNYNTNGTGQLASTVTGAITTNYTYDPDGRRTNSTDGGTNQITSTYDARGKASSVFWKAGAASGTEYRRYDGEGRLVHTNGGGPGGTGSFDWTWDPTSADPQIASVKFAGGGSGNIFSGFGQLAAKLSAGNTVVFTRDWHGNEVNNATFAGPTDYEPFGKPTTGSGAVDWYGSFTYNTEATTFDGLYLRARDYDYVTGQFTSRDPLDGVDGTTTTGNRYHYSDNDPLNSSDPLGLSPHHCDQNHNCKYIVNDMSAYGWEKPVDLKSHTEADLAGIGAEREPRGTDIFGLTCRGAAENLSGTFDAAQGVGIDPQMAFSILIVETQSCFQMQHIPFTDISTGIARNSITDLAGKTKGVFNMHGHLFDLVNHEAFHDKLKFNDLRNAGAAMNVTARAILMLNRRLTTYAHVTNHYDEVSVPEIRDHWNESTKSGDPSQFFFRSSLIGGAWYSGNEDPEVFWKGVLEKGSTFGLVPGEGFLGEGHPVVTQKGYDARCYFNLYSSAFNGAGNKLLSQTPSSYPCTR